MSTNTNNTPKAAPSENTPLKELPKDIQTKITPEQYQEVIDAQKAAASSEASKRLETLKTQISAPTQAELEKHGVKLSDLAEEKGIIDKAKEKGAEALAAVASVIPSGVKEVFNKTQDVVTNPSTAFQSTVENNKPEFVKKMEGFMESMEKFLSLDFWKDFFGKLFSGNFKEAFALFSLDDVYTTLKKKGAEFMEKFLPTKLSDTAKTAITNVLKIKDFANLTIEELRKKASESDIAKALGMENKLSHSDIKMFADNFFNKEAFAKMSTVVENTMNGAKIDEKTMTIKDFMSKLG